MLVPAPENKAKKKAKGVRSGPRRKGGSDVSSEDETHSSAAEDDDEEEEESNAPPDGGRKKRAASTNLEAEVANMVNHIANYEFGEDWQFGKEAYSHDNPPLVVSRISLLLCLLCGRIRFLILVGFF